MKASTTAGSKCVPRPCTMISWTSACVIARWYGRGDRMVEFTDGRLLASGIDGARFVPLETSNHLVLGDEPAWRVFVDEVTTFLEPDRHEAGEPSVDVASLLSSRELDVLKLAARGHSNDEIAAELFLSARTVERHLQNAYAKLGVSGKAARTAAVAMLLGSQG